MNIRFRKWLCSAVAFSFAGTVGVAVRAADFPTKPVRLIVSFPAGSQVDTLSRQIGSRMSADLGVPVVIDNKPGAATFIGMQALLQSEPDGHTIAMTSVSTLSINQFLFTKMPYDAARDFAPVAYLGGQPFVLLSNTSFGPGTVREAIAYVKANPGAVNVASAGVGNSTHILAEKFSRDAGGLSMVHVPHNGSGPALISLVSGNTQLYFDALPNALPLATAGKIRVLAVTSKDRVSLLPNVPTMTESGMRDFVILGWYGLSAPRKAPADAVARLNRAANKALEDKALRTQMDSVGFALAQPGKPSDLTDIAAADAAVWGTVIRAMNIKLD